MSDKIIDNWTPLTFGIDSIFVKRGPDGVATEFLTLREILDQNGYAPFVEQAPSRDVTAALAELDQLRAMIASMPGNKA